MISISKFRIIILLISCFVVWKTVYYFSNNNVQKLFTNDAGELQQGPLNPVTVSVYYEALCSDSRNFILKQLVPAYEKAPNLIKLDLIPYGKATTTVDGDTYKFECQHSYIECEANKIHACVLNQPFTSKVHLNYVACMIRDNMIPHEVGKKCAEEAGVDYTPIEECAKGKEGSLLVKQHGDRTHALSPKVTFIPTVQLNRSSQVPLVYILKDLFKEICKIFGNNMPDECAQINEFH